MSNLNSALSFRMTARQITAAENKVAMEAGDVKDPRPAQAQQVPQMPLVEFIQAMEALGVAKCVGAVHLPDREFFGIKFPGGNVNTQIAPSFIPPDKTMVNAINQAYMTRSEREYLAVEFAAVSHMVVGGAGTLRSIVRRYQEIVKDRDAAKAEAQMKALSTSTPLLDRVGRRLYRLTFKAQSPEVVAEALVDVPFNHRADQGIHYNVVENGSYKISRIGVKGSNDITPVGVAIAKETMQNCTDFLGQLSNKQWLQNKKRNQPDLFYYVLKVKVARYPLWRVSAGDPDAENIKKSRPFAVPNAWLNRLGAYYENLPKDSYRHFWERPADVTEPWPVGLGANLWALGDSLYHWYYEKQLPQNTLDYIVYGDNTVARVHTSEGYALFELDVSSCGPSQPKATWLLQQRIIKRMFTQDGKEDPNIAHALTVLQETLYNAYNATLVVSNKVLQMQFGQMDGVAHTTGDNTRLMVVIVEQATQRWKEQGTFTFASIRQILVETAAAIGLKLRVDRFVTLDEAQDQVDFEGELIGDTTQWLDTHMPRFLKCVPVTYRNKKICLMSRRALVEAFCQPSGQTNSFEGAAKELNANGVALARYFSLGMLASPYADLYRVVAHAANAIMGTKARPIEIPGEDDEINVRGLAEFAREIAEGEIRTFWERGTALSRMYDYPHSALAMNHVGVREDDVNEFDIPEEDGIQSEERRDEEKVDGAVKQAMTSVLKYNDSRGILLEPDVPDESGLSDPTPMESVPAVPTEKKSHRELAKTAVYAKFKRAKELRLALHAYKKKMKEEKRTIQNTRVNKPTFKTFHEDHPDFDIRSEDLASEADLEDAYDSVFWGGRRAFAEVMNDDETYEREEKVNDRWSKLEEMVAERNAEVRPNPITYKEVQALGFSYNEAPSALRMVQNGQTKAVLEDD